MIKWNLFRQGLGNGKTNDGKMWSENLWSD